MMSSKLEIIREYKRLTEKCETLVELFCQFDSVLDTFEKESGTTVKEAIQILDEIGDSNADLIRLTIARLTDSIGNVEPIAEVPIDVEIPKVINTTPQVVEITEESTETSEVEEKDTPQVEISSNDIIEEDPHKKTITVPGYPHKVSVCDDTGDIYVDNQKINPFMGSDGVVTVNLPIIGGGSFRVAQHKLVAIAYLPSRPAGGKIIHKNGNVDDCRPKNLAWSSMIKRDIPRIDASDAVDISEALLECNFNLRRTMELLSSRHKRCTKYSVDLIRDKKAFKEVSDKYFDEKLRPVKKVTPKLPGLGGTIETEPIENASSVKSLITANSKVFDRKHVIGNALEAHGGNILKAYETSKSLLEGLTIYEVFNVKNASKGKPTEEDIAVIIRCARNGGCDIKETLLNECSLLVTEREIISATRKQL